jgi:hypothetical protein
MLISTHVASGGLIGVLLRRHPGWALAAGISSHFVLDSIPHWGAHDPDDLLRVARVDGAVGATTMGVAALVGGPSVSLGMLGAILPDLGHVTRHFFNQEIYPLWLNRFHASIQEQNSTRMKKEIVRAVIGISLLALVLYFQRRQRPLEFLIRERQKKHFLAKADSLWPTLPTGVRPVPLAPIIRASRELEVKL